MLKSNITIDDFPEHLAKHCLSIAQFIGNEGGRALLVGGCIRDAFMGIAPKDIDIEVYGLKPEVLEKILAQHYDIDCFGKSFAVLKIKRLPIDISLPRRESKTAPGHQGFQVDSDPFMSFEEAASRRDFTLNAIAWDPLSGEVMDPFKGLDDLKEGVLRHTSDKFSEDPLRVLRAMQFSARFDFPVAPETLKLCQSIEPEDLSKERIYMEWEKLMVKSIKPSLGLTFLKESGWLRYFPELESIDGCIQDPEWHPEGDVWVHTLYCMDAFARERIGDAWEDVIVGFAVLCHDLGKPLCTFKDDNGRIRSPGHEGLGEEPTRLFLSRMTEHKDLIESVVPLVVTHLRPIELYKAQSSDAAIRRLAKKVGRIDRLVRVAMADSHGRPPFPTTGPCPECDWLLEKANALAIRDAAPAPIIQGRHLIASGLKPGIHFKEILSKCFEAQLDGLFENEASGEVYLRELLRDNH